MKRRKESIEKQVDDGEDYGGMILRSIAMELFAW
jgi:hypothetical protein